MESMMTDAAPTTNEGADASVTTGNNSVTADALYGDKQQAPEGQSQQASDDAATDVSTEADEGKPQGAPEKYEFTAPEGRSYDTDTMKVFSEVAKELDMSQETAQKMLDKMAPAVADRQAKQMEVIRNEWAQSSQSDKEFGGDKLNENLSIAKKALDSFGSPELRTLLNESGLGNNPEVIRFMYRAGKAISEETFVGNSAGAGSKGLPRDFNSAAAALYSNQQS
jgi:hypothetical protein